MLTFLQYNLVLVHLPAIIEIEEADSYKLEIGGTPCRKTGRCRLYRNHPLVLRYTSRDLPNVLELVGACGETRAPVSSRRSVSRTLSPPPPLDISLLLIYIIYSMCNHRRVPRTASSSRRRRWRYRTRVYTLFHLFLFLSFSLPLFPESAYKGIVDRTLLSR